MDHNQGDEKDESDLVRAMQALIGDFQTLKKIEPHARQRILEANRPQFKELLNLIQEVQIDESLT